MTYKFLTDTYETERLKTLSVWSMFRDEDMCVRPHPSDRRGRSVLEEMVHQCVSEDLWFRTILEIDVGAPPLPTNETATLSSKSIRNLKAHLSGVLSVAEEWEWIQPRSNPAKGRFRLPDEKPVRARRILTPAQFQGLLAELDEPYGTVVLVAVLAGLRKGEIAALRWDDILPGRVNVDEAV